MSFTIKERAKCVVWFDWMQSVVAVQRKFRAEFNKDAPSNKSILKWHSMFMETGSVQDISRKRTLTARSDENVARVEHHFTDDNKTRRPWSGHEPHHNPTHSQGPSLAPI